MSIAYYLPGLTYGLSWNPTTRILHFNYNENQPISRMMPDSFTADDFARAMEINNNWRSWKSHNSRLSFDPNDLGIASAETTAEALYLFIYSF